MSITDRDFENGKRAFAQAEAVRILGALISMQITHHLPIANWTISLYTPGVTGQVTELYHDADGVLCHDDKRSKENVRSWGHALISHVNFYAWKTQPGGEYILTAEPYGVPIHIWAYVEKAR